MDLKSNGGLIMSNSLRKLLVLMCLITILSACTSDKNESDNQEQNNMNTEESNVDNVNKDFSGNFQYELPTTI